MKAIAAAPALALRRLPKALPADRHPFHVYLRRLSSGSRRTMRQAAEVIAITLSDGNLDAGVLPWGELRYQHTVAIRTDLAERYAPATANKFLSCLRGILREAWRLGYMSAEDYRRAVDLERVRGQREEAAAGRALDAGEIRALFADCARDRSPLGARDAALLAVLYAAGLRRSEVVTLNMSDFNGKTGKLTVRRGKGRKARTVYAENGGKDAIEAWLATRGDAPGPMFHALRKGGQIERRRITAQAVYKALQARAEAAGVSKFSPHDLRRSMIGDMLDAGVDLVTVQKLVGHAAPDTTAGYDRRGEQAKIRAAGMLHVPFRRRRA